MRQSGFVLLCGVLLAAGPRVAGAVETQNGQPTFAEVYDLLRQQLQGVTEADLNRTAAHALVSALAPRVQWVSNDVTTAQNPLVINSNVFDGQIGYLRIGRVSDGLPGEVSALWRGLAHGGKLKGLVLDLRYASGDSYPAAAAVADLFLKKEHPLLDWGNGLVRSKAKPECIGVPVAVLLNKGTAAGAEALAAALRESGAGLLLGGRTAGQAMVMQEFTLAGGQRLRIARAPVRLGDGAALSADGLQPDIAVEVDPQDERAYYADAYAVLPNKGLFSSGALSATNQAAVMSRNARRTRLNEAELLRERREGTEGPETGAPRESEADKPVVRDPVLARALDLLKGLAVVRHVRS
jgi:C-terminal processing protease CtpA/Prc